MNMKHNSSFDVAKGVTLCLHQESPDKKPNYGFQPVQIITGEWVDPFTASEWLQNYNTFPAQRKLNRKQVAEYKRKMKAGLWHHTTISFARVVNGKGEPVLNEEGTQELMLVNGQHTLNAIAEGSDAIPVTIHIYETTHRVAEDLFGQFDDGKNRTFRDVLAPICHTFGTKSVTVANKGGKREVHIVTPIQIVKIAKAIWWATEGGRSTKCPRPSRDKMIAIARKEKKFVSWLLSLCLKQDKPFSESHIWKQSVIASMYVTWNHGQNEEMATEFWKRVTMNINHAPNTPTHSLLSFLSQYSTSKFHMRHANVAIMTVCADCWNLAVESGMDAEVDYSWTESAKKERVVETLFDGSTLDEGIDAVGTEIETELDDETKTGHTDHRQSIKASEEDQEETAEASPPPAKDKKSKASKSRRRASTQDSPVVRL